LKYKYENSSFERFKEDTNNRSGNNTKNIIGITLILLLYTMPYNFLNDIELNFYIFMYYLIYGSLILLLVYILLIIHFDFYKQPTEKIIKEFLNLSPSNKVLTTLTTIILIVIMWTLFDYKLYYMALFILVLVLTHFMIIFLPHNSLNYIMLKNFLNYKCFYRSSSGLFMSNTNLDDLEKLTKNI
jgi:hypothetical protein